MEVHGDTAIHGDVDLSALRRKMAAMSGRPGHSQAPPAGGNSRPIDLPEGLAGLISAGGLRRGTVVVSSGARSTLLAMIAAASGGGARVAVVGLQKLSMLSALEMGADLARIALVPDPGADRLEVASVLLDGMDLVVLGLGGTPVPPSRAKVLASRVRNQDAVLVVTDGRWPGAQLRWHTEVVGIDHRRGRIAGWRLRVIVSGRGRTEVAREFDFRSEPSGSGGRLQWIPVTETVTTGLAVAN